MEREEVKKQKKRFGGKQEGSGRPKKDIDEKILYKLAQTLLPVEIIADILGCSRETIYSRFPDILRTGRAERKSSLVQAMWAKALYEKDTKMMIWLSKQHLSYKEPRDEENSGPPITVTVNPFPK